MTTFVMEGKKQDLTPDRVFRSGDGNDCPCDVLVSRETCPKIEEFLIGNGYSRRPGPERHLYVDLLGGRIPFDVYVEGEERDEFVLPDPRGSRIRVLGRWYASLPLLITLKIRADDLGDVTELIHSNNLGEDFADSLEPNVRENFLGLLREAGHGG